MQPGVYSISNEQYHASPGISRSAIMDFRKTPRHYWHKHINPHYVKSAPTPAMILGEAFHVALLEPETFEERFIVKEKSNLLIGKLPLLRDVGREAYDEAKKKQEAVRTEKERLEKEFEERSIDKIVIDEDDYQKIITMKGEILSDDTNKEIVTDAKVEQSIFWIDPDTQLLCKCRPDIWHNAFVVDLKTTNDASEEEFRRSIVKYGYHIQFAMIREGLKRQCEVDMRNFIILAQEKEAPFLSAVYQLDDEALTEGHSKFKDYLQQIKSCHDNNSFPGYETKMISLPTWSK